MFGIRILIALAAVALAAFMAAAPAAGHGPLLGDDGIDIELPDLGGTGGGGGSGGSGGGGSGGSGGTGGGGAGGNAATVDVSAGDVAAKAAVGCIRANVLGVRAKVGTCRRGSGGGGNGGGGNGGGGNGGGNDAVDAGADAGDVGADIDIGCIDVGLGELGDGLQIGSCEALLPPSSDDPGDGGSGELPAGAGGGTGTGGDGSGGGGGSLGDEAGCIAVDAASSGMPYGIPTWLAGLIGAAMFGLGALVTRRRRPHAEDVAV